MIVEIAMLGFLTIGLVILVFMALLYGPLKLGTLQTVKFMFESGYSGELSTTSFLISKSGYFTDFTDFNNLLAEYAITGDDHIKEKINDMLKKTFPDNLVILAVGDKTISTGICGKSNKYVIITRKVPLLDGNAEEAKFWVFNCE